MVFIWYFNGIYIGGGMEGLRHQDLWTWAMILCFFSLGMNFFADFFGVMLFYVYFCRKSKISYIVYCKI